MSTFLDYRVDEQWRMRAQDFRADQISRFELSTCILTGDQVFLIDGKDFSFIGFSIPLLEFARSLVLSISELANGADTAISHPLDIDESLTFARDGASVWISATVSGERTAIDLRELSDAIHRHARRLLVEFVAAYPRAAISTVLFEWYPVRELGLEGLFCFC